MRARSNMRLTALPSLIAAFATATAMAFAGPARAQRETAPSAADETPVAAARTELPERIVTMSVGKGQLVHLPRAMAGIFVADDKIADVQAKSSYDFYLFAKGAGETSVYATDRAGHVVWSSNVRVGNNIADVAGMLRAAMPEADIKVACVSGMVLLTGTVLGPKDAEEAQRLTELFTASTAPVLNRLKVATPQQVHLQVKIVEVSRSVAKDIGLNLASRDKGGFLFGIGQGDPGTIKTITTDLDADSGGTKGSTAFTFKNVAGTTLGLAGHAFGLDLLSTLQLYESDGLATVLAEPTLTALSGETASFLAGGEIPIPQSQGLGAVSVEFKQYGVSLAFTPTVLSGGHILLKVRPEVSQISDLGAVKLDNFTIPALTTRRVETTVDLGSGQSFVIGGLLQNNHNNTIAKAPFLGDLPILGALFRSSGFRKQETELVVVVTPYLVKPVDANRIALPTDGYRAPGPASRVLEGRQYGGTSGAQRLKPTIEGGGAPGPSPAGGK